MIPVVIFPLAFQLPEFHDIILEDLEVNDSKL